MSDTDTFEIFRTAATEPEAFDRSGGKFHGAQIRQATIWTNALLELRALNQ